MTAVNEWDDMMPHTLEVRSATGVNAQGRPTYVGATMKKFKCLVDGGSKVVRNEQGAVVSVEITAYTWGVPFDPAGQTVPVAVKDTDEVRIVAPGYNAIRPVVSVSTHFWQDGNLHNQEVRFS